MEERVPVDDRVIRKSNEPGFNSRLIDAVQSRPANSTNFFHPLSLCVPNDRTQRNRKRRENDRNKEKKRDKTASN